MAYDGWETVTLREETKERLDQVPGTTNDDKLSHLLSEFEAETKRALLDGLQD